MANEEEIATKVIKAIGGVGGAIISVAGGGSEGAKAAQDGTGAINDIIAIATGTAERNKKEAAAATAAKDAASTALADAALKLREREIQLEERRLALAVEQARLNQRDRIRDFDAPLYPAGRYRSDLAADAAQQTGQKTAAIAEKAERNSQPESARREEQAERPALVAYPINSRDFETAGLMDNRPPQPTKRG